MNILKKRIFIYARDCTCTRITEGIITYYLADTVMPYKNTGSITLGKYVKKRIIKTIIIKKKYLGFSCSLYFHLI